MNSSDITAIKAKIGDTVLLVIAVYILSKEDVQDAELATRLELILNTIRAARQEEARSNLQVLVAGD